jgi:hypothetical protein
MSKRDRKDVDTSVGRGRGQEGADVGPTAGHAGAPSTDDGLALGGTREAAGDTGMADRRDFARRDESAGGGFGSGLETGGSSVGNPDNAAARVDTFNVPGERRANDPRVPEEERDEYRGRSTGGEHL